MLRSPRTPWRHCVPLLELEAGPTPGPPINRHGDANPSFPLAAHATPCHEVHTSIAVFVYTSDRARAPAPPPPEAPAPPPPSNPLTNAEAADQARGRRWEARPGKEDLQRLQRGTEFVAACSVAAASSAGPSPVAASRVATAPDHRGTEFVQPQRPSRREPIPRSLQTRQQSPWGPWCRAACRAAPLRAAPTGG